MLPCGSKRTPQVRQQLRHLPHPFRRVFRHHHGGTEFRTGLHGLRRRRVREHALPGEVQPEQPSFPSMRRLFVDRSLERGASVAPTEAPRAADSSAPVVSCVFSFVYFVNCVCLCVCFVVVLYFIVVVVFFRLRQVAQFERAGEEWRVACQVLRHCLSSVLELLVVSSVFGPFGNR